MSQWRGRIEDIDEPGDVVDLVGAYYHVPSLVVLLGFMLWTRTRNWKNFLIDGTVYFSGNDPWYHYRATKYTVQNWPQTIPFDPWTYFPYGAHSSQFGTVMDQIVATAALVIGLGSPSDHTIRMVSLFAPAIFGTAIAIPAYVIGRRAANRLGGIVAVAVLAFAGSTVMARGSVGFYDHQIAEALFMTLAILATMVAVSVAEDEKPVWELFTARDAEAVRRPVGWALVAGFATAMYVWTWPPGVFLVGILGVYYMIELSSEYAHGESPEHVAIVGAISLSTTGVLTLASIEEIGISATSLNLVQPGLAFAVAAGCVFLAWLAREWDARGFTQSQYPLAVLGILAVLASLFAVVLPDIFDFFVKQTLRVVGLEVTNTAATIGEAQPLDPEALYDRYRFIVFIALVGVSYVFAGHLFDKPRAELTLLSVWTVFMLLATLTQQRFDYYLGMTFAVMTGFVVGEFVEFAQVLEFEGDIETYQLLTILSIVLVVFAPLVYPTAIYMETSGGGPGADPVAWDQSLSWMDENAPEEGNFAGAGNEMPYYGTFERTEDFDYEEGFYGVLSWWDYGHWITTMGERVPNANPFQQGADQAANFLLAGDEEQANDVLERMSEGNNTETRYVMVDWKMVSPFSKYTAPFQFYSDGNISVGNYISSRFSQTRNGGLNRFFLQDAPYYNTTMVRLYRFHGSRREAQPVVLDWTRRSAQGGQVPVINGTRNFDSMQQARQFVENDRSSRVGGFGRYPTGDVPALEQYRLVQGSDRPTPIRPGGGRTNWVKTFEHVSGATISGDGPANTTVTASVEMRVPSSNGTFTYQQQAETDESGAFEMTVPYSSTGYDEYGPENGYTNVSVRATGPYTIETDRQFNESAAVIQYNDSVHVTEGQVIGQNDSVSEVSLDRQVLSPPQDINVSNPNGTDSPNGTESTNETDTTGTDSNGSDSSTGTTTPSDSGTATATPSGSDTSTDDSTSGSDIADPSGAGLDPATLVPLLGAGLVSLVLARRRS